MAKRVLLAEDDPNIVVSLTFLLERAGYTVAAETNGRAVLETVIKNPPDVMVLDAMLPELDGFEILRKLRADPRAASLPVLMLTAKGQRVDRENAIACGADRFMTKPFANAEVVAAVNELAAGAKR